MPGSVSITESKAQPVISPDVDFGMVVIGYASDSPLPAGKVSVLYSSPSALAEDYEIGDAVDAACQAIAKTDGNPQPPPIALCPTPDTTPGSMGTTDVTGITGTATATSTPGAEPKGTYQVVGLVVDDGNDGDGTTIGTAGIMIEYSLDNGRTFLPRTALGTATVQAVLLPGNIDTGASFTFGPTTTNAALIALAVEARADTLAHLADVTAHDAADTSAAQVALAASSVPSTTAQAWAVINLCVDALASHQTNITAHNGPDPVNLVTAPVATDVASGIVRGIDYKTKFNLHLGIALAGSSAGLLAATASSASPVTVLAAAMIAGGVAALDLYPRRLTFTTAGGTPADAPDTADISGFKEGPTAQTENAFGIPQTATTTTTTKAWRGTGLSVAYVAGEGTDATVAIGYGMGVHNSADVTNVITSADPTFGTLKTGDTWSSKTAPPMWSNADLFTAGDPATGAFAAIAESSSEFGVIVISEPVATSNFATLVAGLNYGLSLGKRWALLVRFRDPTEGETDAAYIAAFQAFRASNHDNRITCCAGSGWLTDAFRGYVYLRSGLPAVLARFQANAVVGGRFGERLAQHPGYVARGPLEGFSLVDSADNLIGHDEAVRGGIDGPLAGVGGGLTFLRVPNPDIPGTFVSEAPVMYPALSTILTFMDRRLANGIERVASAIAWLEIKGADIWDPITFALDDDIRDGIAGKIGKAIKDRYEKEFQNPADPNLVVINPTVTVNGEKVTISGVLKVRFYGYTHTIELTFSASR